MANSTDGDIKVVADAVANVALVAGKDDEIGRIGTSAMAASIALIGTDAYAHATTGDIKVVADNITGVNDFALRYRIGDSDPTSANDAGDLFWNRTSNQFKVYNATTSSWVQPYLTSANVDTIANNAAVAMSIALG